MAGHDAAAALTRELVAFRTVNPPGLERDCARRLGAMLEAAGFAVASHEFAEGRTSLIATHGSMPELGDNAILKMARIIGDLEHFRFPVASHAVMGEPTLNIGTIRGGLNTNSVPDEARITVDTRTVPGIDHGALCESLAQLLAPRGARVRMLVAEMPMNAGG